MPGSPAPVSLFPQRVIIGVGELAVSNNPGVTLSTYALGSCVAVVAFDPAARGGGILHIMLPESSLAPDKAAQQPAMFADSGIPALFNALAGIRTERRRLRLFVAGGASVSGGPDVFRIGERNTVAVLRMLAVYGCPIVGNDSGGVVNRTLHLDLATGRLTLRRPDRTTCVEMG
ncbi:chemotaxis protein [Opitutaceae bacterium TAV1]|nr:chemotaxis protein [Opitutaceae bacterium TAV1]